MFSFALALAVLIGLSLGLLGSGGSIITLPVLVYVAKVPAPQAVGMSLVIVGGTSALGTLLNLRQDAFDWRAAAFESGAIAVRVIDSGSGISDAVRPKLFHPFFTTKPGGSGLGLAIVHRAVEAHHGVVVVDSDQGGARFTVLFPRT